MASDRNPRPDDTCVRTSRCCAARVRARLLPLRASAGQSLFPRRASCHRAVGEFDLGWVSVANPSAKLAPGEMVAVLARAAGLWSLNLSRIVEAIDTPTHFGFLYATTAMHVEAGQERFLLEFDAEHGSVTYLIEAISRPQHPLARLAYPFARALQQRFAKQSHQRMRIKSPQSSSPSFFDPIPRSFGHLVPVPLH